MKIVVIDGQGGRVGKAVIDGLKNAEVDADIVAIGTNGLATATMMKAGLSKIATGENAIVVNAKNADIIVGPVGIVVADALLGEITPKMAKAVAQSSANLVLLPLNKCNIQIMGVVDQALSMLIQETVEHVKKLVENKKTAC